MSHDAAVVAQVYEAVVVGAGAAGLAAAAVLGRSGRGVLVVGGRDRANTTALEVHNLPYAEGVPPDRLYEAMEDELARLGVPVLHDEAREVRPDSDPAGLAVTLAADGVEVRARRLLLATGARHHLPGWVPPGTWGVSVFDCPFCHAREHAGEAFVVVGTGLPAVETALLCVDHAASMTVVISDGDVAAGPAANRLRGLGGDVVIDSVDQATTRSGATVEMLTSSGRRLAAGAVLLTGTLRPRAALFDQLELRMASYGVPEIDDEGRSSHSLVWVAGMAVRPYYMLAESIGSGVRAAVSIHKDLALAGLPGRR